LLLLTILLTDLLTGYINYSINYIAKMWLDYNEYVRNKKLLNDKTTSFNVNKQNISELPELPKNLKELHCYHNNLIELLALPNKLTFLDCTSNKLIELPELPETLSGLLCSRNNIKYLSQHNCLIIKNIYSPEILNNPVSDGFDCDEEFKASL
jgi:hypothetical protein